jgi:hypothetical protein
VASALEGFVAGLGTVPVCLPAGQLCGLCTARAAVHAHLQQHTCKLSSIGGLSTSPGTSNLPETTLPAVMVPNDSTRISTAIYSHEYKQRKACQEAQRFRNLSLMQMHLLARRALPSMAHFRAGVPTRQPPPTHGPAAELIPTAALLHDCLAAKAARINKQWAGRAGPWVAQQQAAVLAAAWQGPAGEVARCCRQTTVTHCLVNRIRKPEHAYVHCKHCQIPRPKHLEGLKCLASTTHSGMQQANRQASANWLPLTYLPQSSPQECGASHGSHSGSCCLPQ